MIALLVSTWASVATAQPTGTVQPQAGLSSTPTADAKPVDRGYAGLGVVLGTSETWIFSGLTAEGGVAIPHTPLRVRGFLVLKGESEQSDYSGDFSRYGGGVELRGCASSVCGFVDLDVGHQTQTLFNGNSGAFGGSRSGPVLGPRLGIDVGGRRVRFRAALELYRYKVHRDPSVWHGSGGLAFALVYQF